MLLAIALLSVIITLAYTSFNQIAFHSKTLNQNIQSQQKLRLLMHVVSEDLRSARYLTSLIEVQQPSGIELGSRRVGGKMFSWVFMHVVGRARLHRNAKPLLDPYVHEAGYEITQKNDTFMLVRREDYYIDSDIDQGGIKQVLATGVQAFVLELLPLHADEERGWVKEWQAVSRQKNDRMPVAVRFTMAIQSDSGKIFKEQLTFNLEQTLYSALRTKATP